MALFNKRTEGGKKIKFIDLSVEVSHGHQDFVRTEILYKSHEEGRKNICKVFNIEESEFPYDDFNATELVTLGTHSGTHLDAPWHYGPTSEGKPAKTVDQIPLEWCFGDGVVLDFTHKKKGELITTEDVQQALRAINYTLKPFDIVLIRTDTSKHFNEPGYEHLHSGMGREATLWLIDQGIRVMGIDAWGWDRPFDVMVDELRSGIKDKFLAAHRVGREKEYCHLEKLSNLDQIPKPYGFTVVVFPIRIERASAGWVRAVAIVEE